MRRQALKPEQDANRHGDIATMTALAPQPSTSCIGIVLGAGRAFPMRQSKPYKCPFMGFPKCRVNIIVEYADGTKQKFCTDEKWSITANVPIRSNNEYDGETYDARLELGEWATTGYDDKEWMKAERTDIPLGEVIGQPAPNMQVVKTIKPVSVTRTGKLCHIIDFGQNTAGWIKMNMRGKAGDTIRVKFAEKLRADGIM